MAEDKKYYHNIDLDKNKVKNILLNPLSTSERTALSLSTTDKGYVVFDTSLNSQYFWNGTQWIQSSGSTPTLQSVLNVGNGASNYGGIGNASIQLTNFTNNRTLYINDNNYPTIKIVDNLNSNHTLSIDLDTITLNGTSYNWSSIISPSSPSLQQVTNINKVDGYSVTTNPIKVDSTSAWSQIDADAVGTENKITGTYAYIGADGIIGLKNTLKESTLKNTNVTNNVYLEFPNPVDGTYTLPLSVNGVQPNSSGDISITSSTSTNVVADVSVGAINAGDTIPIGTDIQELVTQIFSKTFYPTFTAPTFSLSNNAGTREIGSTATVRLTFTYNRGSINGKLVTLAGITTWNPSTSQGTRSGAATSYLIDGNTTSNNYYDVSVTFTPTTITKYATVTYAAGPQPTDSKTNNYDAPYPAGTSPSQSTTISAIYPYFWYKSSNPISATDMQTAIASGAATKVVGDSTGTLSITFAAAGEYLAVAYPATSTTKTKWWVSISDNQAIPGGTLNSAVSLNCTSTYWSGISYKIHVSPAPITMSVDYPTAELRNV